MELLFDVFKEALMITGFVFVMMLVIEYANVLTRGNWDRALSRWKWGQPVLTSFLGVTPGCLGAFAVGSLYMHGVITFGALVAAMVATCGDEAFVMLALFPGRALLLMGILFGAGVLWGTAVDLALGRRTTRLTAHLRGYTPSHAHEEARCVPFSRHELTEQWRRCSPQRGWLAVFLLLFVLGVLAGEIGHAHLGVDPAPSSNGGGVESVQAGPAEAHEEEHGHGAEWNWVRVTLLIVGLIGLLIVVTVPDHFLEEHLWNHIARVHVWKIFLWTCGALLVTHFLMDRVDMRAMISANHLSVLLTACLLGIIPESGPHLVFVTLYAQGGIPFSVLLASSLVQDGHGMIPMLAHSRRAFLAVKAVNFVLGLGAGLLGYAMGW